jgi:hypothetical protein
MLDGLDDRGATGPHLQGQRARRRMPNSQHGAPQTHFPRVHPVVAGIAFFVLEKCESRHSGALPLETPRTLGRNRRRHMQCTQNAVCSQAGMHIELGVAAFSNIAVLVLRSRACMGLGTATLDPTHSLCIPAVAICAQACRRTVGGALPHGR